MKKVLRIISIVLLGVAAAAMFLFWEPLFNGQSISSYAIELDVVKYVAGGLLILSGIFSFRSIGFKNKRVLRIITGAVIAGVALAARVIPNKQIPVGPAYINLTYAILGGGLVVSFLLLFVMHLTELRSRRGLTKIFAPITDLVLMAFTVLCFAKLIVPLIDQISFYEYVELGLQYGHYAVGGLLAVEFVFAFIGLFIKRPAK